MTNKIKSNVYYHGNENPIHKFSEYQPPFFTEDYNYALGYGDHVKAYRINSVKPFDPSTDEIARNYYNESFLKHELGVGAKPLGPGESISCNHADNFWAFISVEEEIGNGFGYDAIVVQEFLGSGDFSDSFTTNLSFVPFELSQVEEVKSIDFESSPNNPILKESESDKLFELMGLHTHGKCHALSSYLSKQGLGELMMIKSKDSAEINHSFVLSKNGMCIDGRGVMSIYDMLLRYSDCTTDNHVSDFKVESISVNELLKHSTVNQKDILLAKTFWNLATQDYNTELKEALELNEKDPLISLRSSEFSM